MCRQLLVRLLHCLLQLRTPPGCCAPHPQKEQITPGTGVFPNPYPPGYVPPVLQAAINTIKAKLQPVKDVIDIFGSLKGGLPLAAYDPMPLYLRVRRTPSSVLSAMACGRRAAAGEPPRVPAATPPSEGLHPAQSGHPCRWTFRTRSTPAPCPSQPLLKAQM